MRERVAFGGLIAAVALGVVLSFVGLSWGLYISAVAFCLIICWGAVLRRAEAAQTVPIKPRQAEAMCRLLIDSGDMTPMAHRQLRKLWGAYLEKGDDND